MTDLPPGFPPPAFGPPAFGIDGLFDPVEVGRGGMGVVYRVQQPLLRRELALKVLIPGADPANMARLAREAAVLGALSGHPNVVPIIATGVTAPGAPYLLMPFFSAGSVAGSLRARGQLPVVDVVHIGIAIAGALSVAHEGGIVHRDVKPENILLSDYGEPMIADFGISRIADGYQTTAVQVSATLAHAAPEVIEGRPPSAATDIYALASTLHQLLAGEPPFAPREDEALVALFLRIARDPVPDLRGRGVPASLCDVLELAMQKDPSKRPATMAEFGRRLQVVEQALGTGPTVMVGPPAESMVGPPAESGPTVVAEAGSVDGNGDGSAAAPLVGSEPGGTGPDPARKRTVVVGVAIVVVMLLVVAAVTFRSRSKNVAIRNDGTTGTAGPTVAVPSSTGAATPSVGEQGSSRSNPLPFGNPAIVGPSTSQWRVTVGFVQEDFTAEALAPDTRNKKPANGSRYVAAHLLLEYLGPQDQGRPQSITFQAFTSRRGPIERTMPGIAPPIDCSVAQTVRRNEAVQCALPFELRDDELHSFVLRSTDPEIWFAANG